MTARRREWLDVLAILAVDAGIPPWEADRLPMDQLNAILDLLETRAEAARR